MGDDANNTLVLVVEDEPNIREIINFNLESWGFDVAQATDGEMALAMVAERHPDLILLDLMIPKVDGIEVCRRLKTGFQTSGIPIIMLTARKEVAEKVKGMEAGADDYITKPFSREELEARIKMVLNRTRSQLERSPLTGLPGQGAVRLHVERLLAAGASFTFVYLDLDGFKAFNDYYGYPRGDDVIKLAADVLTATITSKGGAAGYVGHIGGDDFMFVCDNPPAKDVCDTVIATFEARVVKLYNPEDVARGYIVTIDRLGQKRHQPTRIYMTLAAVPCEPGHYASFVEIIDVATDLKKYGKTREGSVAVFDRRAGKNGTG